MLDVHRLRIFRAVAAAGSLQAAASQLSLTPSAVSQQVAALQRETGLVLISRVGRGIEITPAGRSLAERIDGVLGRLADLESVAKDLREGRSGTLSIAYFGSVGSAWMPQVVRRLLDTYPDLRLDLVQAEVLALEEQRPDLQLVVEQPAFAAPPGTRLVPLVEEPYVAVLPREHPLAAAPGVRLADLAGERWIDNDVHRGWCRRNLLESCAAAGFEPAFAVETQDYPTAIAFVAAGVGLTVLPRLGAHDLPPEVVAVPLHRPTPVRRIHALVRTATAHHAPAQTALALLAECAEAHRRRLADAEVGVAA